MTVDSATLIQRSVTSHSLSASIEAKDKERKILPLGLEPVSPADLVTGSVTSPLRVSCPHLKNGFHEKRPSLRGV